MLSRVLAVVCALALSSGALGAEDESEFHGFYLLSFDRYGRLTNPYELDLAVLELRAHAEVERIVIVAYGWANDGEASLGGYQTLLSGIVEQLPGRTAIIGVGWDSSQTGIRKLFNDLIPLPVVADAVAVVPDRVLFPLSFWSKAAMADRIGYGGLRTALNQLFALAYPPGSGHPDLYLVGHSFGTRIMCGLLIDELAYQKVGAAPFESRARVRGALLIQPALAAANLPTQGIDFPLVVTQSENDRANSFLFPVANLFINSFSFTAAEALIQQRLFAPVEQTAQLAAEGASDVVEAGGKLLGVDVGEDESEAEVAAKQAAPREPDMPPVSAPGRADTARPIRKPLEFPAQAYRATRRTGSELLGIPAAFAFSVLTAPVQYVYAQGKGLATHPIDHVMDTLAQLPGVEILVSGVGRATQREIPWGRRSKGFFGLGSLHESVGRLSMPAWPIRVPSEDDAHTLAQLGPPPADPDACPFPSCDGVVLVDLTDDVGGGLFGDLRNPWIGMTVGWFDLTGTHSAYADPKITGLLLRVMRVDGSTEPAAASASAPAP
jgi:hypothetical protein